MTSEGPVTHLREHPELIAEDLCLLRDRMPAGARILDAGAGRGAFVKAAIAAGFDAVALDMEPGAIAVWGRDRVPGTLGTGDRAPFHDTCFDVVRMKEVIEHVEKPLGLVREARRLLRPGGMLLAHTPTPYSQLYPVGNFWDDYTHVRPFSRLGLTRLIADGGLRLERIDAYTAGRNGFERALGKLLARVFPHIYRVIAIRDA